MQVNDNIVPFPETPKSKVWESIEVFLERKGQNSKNTRTTYERAIRDFFLATRKKKLEHLTEDDIRFSKVEVEGYQVGLRAKFKASTVNTRMWAMKSLYSKLKDYGFNVESSWFDLDSYDEHDKESYDPMTHAEVVEAIRLVLKTRQGKQKALLIRLAYATAFRKESLLEMKKTDILYRNGTWFVRVLGKGNKWDYKKISNDLHDELMERVKVATKDKVFTLTDRTVNGMMNHIRHQIDFGGRNITFHSLKKSSVEEVALITNNDLVAMQSHANHESASTTIESYMSKKKLDDLVVVDINYHVPVEAFDNLSQEELVTLIKSMDRNTQIKLLQKLGAI